MEHFANISLPRWVFSVRTKLTLVTSSLIMLISIFIYWFFPNRLEKQAVVALGEKANGIVAMMAYSVGPGMLFDDHTVASDVVISAKQNPDLDYVMVIDDSGNVVASHDSLRAIVTKYANADFVERISDDGRTFQTVSPIVSQGKLLGRVYLGLSLREVNTEITESRRTVAWVSICISAAGILLVVALSAFITTPLARMVAAVERLSSGDWKQRAEVRSRDEVGHLATAFNRMVQSVESAYEDLRKSEKNYRDLFEANPHPMWVHDIESRAILEVNDAAVDCYGFTREEFLRLTVHDVIVDGPFGTIDQLFSRQGNLYRSTGWQHLKKDGVVIDVEMSSHPLPFRSGRRTRLVLANDITKRLRAEILLRESEERYRDLFESASDLIVSVGADCLFQFVNRAWMDTLGYKQEEIARLHIFSTIRESELPRFKVAFRDALNGKRLDHLQTTFVGKDGREIAVEGSLSVRMENNEVVSTRGIFRNITERKRADEAIKLQKTRFEQLFENAPVGIVLADKSGKTIQANHVFQTMFGYSPDELNGRSIDGLVVPREYAEEGELISAKIYSGESVQIETVRCRKDRNLLDVHLYGVPILVNGNSLGLFGMYVDITRRKKAEQKQAELMAELESINKELNDFAYIVSHDLKAPLRAIGSLVDWLTTDYGDKLGEEGGEMLKVLLGRTKRMHDLIDGVLKYSRIGRTKEESVRVELDTIVPEVVEFIAPPSHVEVKIHRPLPIIMGEKTRVQQVFQNLLSNAVKFLDKPKGLIEIGCIRENGHWKFSVADNGPGIEARHFTKIFQIFQTLSPRDDFESTGIGLTIVKKVVETYGGKVWLDSKVGVGTTFYFTLPAIGTEETRRLNEHECT